MQCYPRSRPQSENGALGSAVTAGGEKMKLLAIWFCGNRSTATDHLADAILTALRDVEDQRAMVTGADVQGFGVVVVLTAPQVGRDHRGQAVTWEGDTSDCNDISLMMTIGRREMMITIIVA